MAFQRGAFQSSAFQVVPPLGVGGGRPSARYPHKEILRLLAEQREKALQKAAHLKKKKRDEVLEAAEAAERAIEAVRAAGEELQVKVRLESITRAIEALNGASKLADIMASSAKVVAASKAIVRAAEELNEDDDEAMHILFGGYH